MKKKLILAGLVVIIAFAGFKFLSRQPSGSVSGYYSLKELSDLGKPLECNFLKKEESLSVSGKFFIDNGDIRGDFNITDSPVGPIQSHFIVKDQMSYTWTSISTVGFKKKIVENAGATSTTPDQASLVGTEDRIDYSCLPWIVQKERFELPETISFKDL